MQNVTLETAGIIHGVTPAEIMLFSTVVLKTNPVGRDTVQTPVINQSSVS